MAFITPDRHSLHVVFLEKTLFKTRALSYSIAAHADFIFSVDTKRIIKNRSSLKTELYQDILRRAMKPQDIPNLYDILDDRINLEANQKSVEQIKTYLQNKYIKRLNK